MRKSIRNFIEKKLKKMKKIFFKKYEKNGFVKMREQVIKLQEEIFFHKNDIGKMSRRTLKKANYFHFLAN